jgi:hypothetical protein
VQLTDIAYEVQTLFEELNFEETLELFDANVSSQAIVSAEEVRIRCLEEAFPRRQLLKVLAPSRSQLRSCAISACSLST